MLNWITEPVLHLGLVPIWKLISLFISFWGQTLHSFIVVVHSDFRTAVYHRYFYHVLEGRRLTWYANLILTYKRQPLLRWWIDAHIFINSSQFSEVLAFFFFNQTRHLTWRHFDCSWDIIQFYRWTSFYAFTSCFSLTFTFVSDTLKGKFYLVF